MSKVLDARIQQVQRLMEGTICKMEKLALADPNEEDYEKEFLKYKMAVEKIEDVLSDYTIPTALVKEFFPSFSTTRCNELIQDKQELKQLLKEKKKYEDFINVLRQTVIDNYVELNPYYRMLLGVPPFDEDPANFVYVNNKPVHEMERGEILELKRVGKLDTLISNNPDKEYLKYIDKDIDIIYARTAGEYAILWTPKKREFNIYREMFNNERKEWMVTHYNKHLNEMSDYNEILELTHLKLRAIIAFYIYNYSNLLNKSSYSREESEDIFSSFGLNFPSDMPDSYRDSITFVLNYLNTNKGTNYVIKFITSKLFKGLRLFKYWVRKKKKNLDDLNKCFPKDANGVLLPPTRDYEDGSVYTPDEITKVRDKSTDPDKGTDEMSGDSTDLYDVEFILRPINSTNIIDFGNMDSSTGIGKKDKDVNTGDSTLYPINHAASITSSEDLNKAKINDNADKSIILTYDDIKKIDPRWSADDDLKKQVFDEEFSYVESKYIGIDNIINIRDFTVALGVIHRYIVQKKDLLKRVKMEYPGSGATHNFFDIWMYYMTLINYALVKSFKAPIGDTVAKPKHFYGFDTIKTNPQIRLYWLIVFAQYEIDVTLEEFPDPLNDNDTFVRLMQHIERSIGLAKFVDSVMMRARNHVEADMIDELVYHVRYSVKVPEVFDSTVGADKPFMDYLSESDGTLSYLADDIVNRGNSDLALEIDNISTFLVQVLTDLENPQNGDFPDIREGLFMTNMLYGGMSQHLLHVIRLFKAWSVEFIGDTSTMIVISDDVDFLVMIDQITPIYNISMKYRWNITQDHYLDWNTEVDHEWSHELTMEDAVYLITSYGDIKIS